MQLSWKIGVQDSNMLMEHFLLWRSINAQVHVLVRAVNFPHIKYHLDIQQILTRMK